LKTLPADKNGIWHIEAFVHCAEVCIRFEESCCDKETPQCHDIPEWRRIHNVTFDGWDAQALQHSVTATIMVRPNGTDGEWHNINEIFNM